MDDNIVIRKYIAAWMWQLIGIIFLVGGIILASIGITSYTIAFFALWGISEFLAFKRKREFEEVKDESERHI